jgi:metallo-beta-lactamase family protein
VGYQAGNTLGRALVDGAKRVKLFGETVKVAARITKLPGISGHADMNGLLEWAKSVKGVQRFFINHGEATGSESFAQKLRDELGAEVYVPYSGAEFDIAENVVTIDAEPIPIPKKRNSANFNITYSDLVAASDRLAALIRDSDGRTNADMRQLTEAIHKLCDEWKLP